jgi:hypothetical protein
MNRSLLLAAVALAAAAAVALPAAAQQTDEVVVPVTGEAVVRGDSLLAANTAAKMNGYREALRMQLSRLLDSLGAVEAFPRLRARARTYVKAEQIEGEEREADTLRVAMRLTLDVAKLKQDLEQLGYDIRTIGADHGASVMVVIDEYYVPNPRQVSSTQAPPSAMTGRAPSIPDSAFDPYVRPEFREPGARVSASAIEEALNNNQYIVLDQGSVQQLRADMPGFTGDLVKQGDRLTDFARRANERFHAKIVIVGATTVINGGRDGAGQETRRALMSYRAIDASTGPPALERRRRERCHGRRPAGGAAARLEPRFADRRRTAHPAAHPCRARPRLARRAVHPRAVGFQLVQAGPRLPHGRAGRTKGSPTPARRSST